jgi:hypothetical protein
LTADERCWKLRAADSAPINGGCFERGGVQLEVANGSVVPTNYVIIISQKVRAHAQMHTSAVGRACAATKQVATLLFNRAK